MIGALGLPRVAGPLCIIGLLGVVGVLGLLTGVVGVIVIVGRLACLP